MTSTYESILWLRTIPVHDLRSKSALDGRVLRSFLLVRLPVGCVASCISLPGMSPPPFPSMWWLGFRFSAYSSTKTCTSCNPDRISEEIDEDFCVGPETASCQTGSLCGTQDFAGKRRVKSSFYFLWPETTSARVSPSATVTLQHLRFPAACMVGCCQGKPKCKKRKKIAFNFVCDRKAESLWKSFGPGTTSEQSPKPFLSWLSFPRRHLTMITRLKSSTEWELLPFIHRTSTCRVATLIDVFLLKWSDYRHLDKEKSHTSLMERPHLVIMTG